MRASGRHRAGLFVAISLPQATNSASARVFGSQMSDFKALIHYRCDPLGDLGPGLNRGTLPVMSLQAVPRRSKEKLAKSPTTLKSSS
jgi:hypothetical protein